MTTWHFEPEKEDDGAALHREEELEQQWWEKLDDPRARAYWEGLQKELKEMLRGNGN